MREMSEMEFEVCKPWGKAVYNGRDELAAASKLRPGDVCGQGTDLMGAHLDATRQLNAIQIADPDGKARDRLRCAVVAVEVARQIRFAQQRQGVDHAGEVV
jgi:hypothetical protein